MTLAATLILIGRVIFGGFFLIAGLRNIAGFKDRAIAQTNYGWPLPGPLLAIGFGTQVLGGLSLMLGLWPVFGALLLIGFLILATGLYHNLFRFQGKERDPHLYFVLVNITLASGLLMVIAAAL